MRIEAPIGLHSATAGVRLASRSGLFVNSAAMRDANADRRQGQTAVL